MATRLHLSIAEDHLQLDLLLPTPRKSWIWKCKRWLAYLNGDDRAFYSLTTSDASALQNSSLAQTLEQMVATVQRSSHRALKGALLDVEVGASDARVGLLDIDVAQTARITRDDLSLYANTWVKHTWTLDPEDYIVRCTPASNAGQYVVTAVKKSVVQALTDVSERLKLRFVDCKPALVAQLTQLPKPNHASIAVCVERRRDGTGTPNAQLVALDADGLVSISNVWAAGDSDTSREAALLHWVQRIGAQHRWTEPIHTSTYSWPAVPSNLAKQSKP